MNKEKIELQGKEYEIEPLKLRGVIKMLGILDEIPEKIANMNDTDDNLKAILTLLSESEDEVIELLAMAGGIDKKLVSELELSESIILTKALIKVNDFDKIKKEVSGLVGQAKSSTGSTK